MDGNVFGGGRGFSGKALTAGSVGGNIYLNITGGTMLGSIYGGGRLASVGTYFVPVNNPNYGHLQPGTGYGYITVNITGGTIGNSRDEALMTADHNTHTIGGNVYGGGNAGNVGGGTSVTLRAGDLNAVFGLIGFAAGILCGNVRGDAQLGQQIRENRMTLVDALRDFLPPGEQRDKPLGADLDAVVLPQILHGNADT